MSRVCTPSVLYGYGVLRMRTGYESLPDEGLQKAMLPGKSLVDEIL